jgi:large subunit ribosomal protein L4
MELKVLNIEGKESGKTVQLSDSVFAIQPNDHAIYLDVKLFLANQRQGTHKSKQRNEISGSTRKLHKQKGTGGSRKGSIKNPLFRGGGRIFGPQPRDYSFKLNKKVKDLARKSALSYKSAEKNIIVLEDFSFDAAKTKNFVSLLNNLKVADTKTLFVLGSKNDAVVLSSRNIQKTKVITFSDINTYEVVNTGKLVLTTSAIEKLNESFSQK